MSSESIARAMLPEDCQSCAFRPIEAGGNGGCDDLQRVLGEFDTASNLAQSLSEFMPPNKTPIDTGELSYAERRLKSGVLDSITVIAGLEVNPSPHGIPVEVCVKPMSKYVGAHNMRVMSSAGNIIAAGRMAIQAQRLGIKLNPASKQS